MASFLVWDTLGSPVGIQLPAAPAAPLPCRRLLPPSCCVSPEMGTRATAGRTLQEGSGASCWASESPPGGAWGEGAPLGPHRHRPGPAPSQQRLQHLTLRAPA